MIARAAWIVAALVLLGGCGTKPIDYPLAAGEANGPQKPLAACPDRPLVLLAISGGGSRAAALGAAVVKRLNNLRYASAGEIRPLAADIAVVSSVSGGSVYAADLGLNGPAHAGSFMDRIQNYDGIGWLEQRALNPVTWVSLQLENTTRVGLLQEMIEDLLQTNATMAAFDGPGNPLILFNATDMVAGQVFTFDRATLDDLCMDYDRVPVSLGVTASAAFPIAFPPVLLLNDSYLPTGCPGRRNAHLPYRVPLEVPAGAYANLEAYRIARYRQSLRNETVREQGSDANVPPYRTPVYVRLVDGGVADNSGLIALRRAMTTVGGPANIASLAARGKLRHLVVIVVNARSDPPNELDTSPKYTTIPTMAMAISGALVDSASASSALAFNSFIELLTSDRDRLVAEGQSQANFAVYPISIDFDQLPNATGAERREQQQVKSIATSWTLQPGDVALLDRVAGKLLWRHPCFRALAADIGLQGIPEAAPVPNTRCAVHNPTQPARAPPTAALQAMR
ncbi:MAG: patatin-like phospholipase family protein [Alphaproteobacteria bacterium]